MIMLDRRLLKLVEARVEKIDENPELLGDARVQAGRYSHELQRQEWAKLLSLPWPQLRTVLLDETDEGERIRQSVPFGGFLNSEERMRVIGSL